MEDTAQTGSDYTATVTAHFSGTDFDRLRTHVKRMLKSARLVGQDLARLDEQYRVGFGELSELVGSG